MGSTEAETRAQLLITGRVQGVGFRYATVRHAEALGVRGWVRNRPDGRVEAVAQGTRSAVDGLIAWCRKAPRPARVFDVAVQWEAPREEPAGFAVR
jgi:acylphosphatase